MDVSKTKSSFYRRLYVAYLIDSGLASSVPTLTEVTGMPRRTAQDTIAALADLDIVCEFEQEEGARNHAGRYRIREWGACLLYTSPSPRDGLLSRMPSSA